MILNSEFKPPEAPYVSEAGLPEKEMGIASSLMGNITDMEKHAHTFSSSLALLDFCEMNDAHYRQEEDKLRKEMMEAGKFPRMERSLWSDWVFVAARSGALAARNFGQSLAAVEELVGAVRTWAPKVDLPAIKEAGKQFRAEFPGVDKVRHSIAHPEYYPNPKKKMGVSGRVDHPAFQGEFGGTVVIRESLFNRQLVATFAGEVVTCDITAEKAKVIRECCSLCFDAFGQLDSRR